MCNVEGKMLDVKLFVLGDMFLNPWYLQPGGEGAQPSKPPSPPSSEEREGSHSPSPAPSLMSCGSHGSGEAGLTGGGVSKQQLSSIQVKYINLNNLKTNEIGKLQILKNSK